MTKERDMETQEIDTYVQSILSDEDLDHAEKAAKAAQAIESYARSETGYEGPLGVPLEWEHRVPAEPPGYVVDEEVSPTPTEFDVVMLPDGSVFSGENFEPTVLGGMRLHSANLLPYVDPANGVHPVEIVDDDAIEGVVVEEFGTSRSAIEAEVDEIVEAAFTDPDDDEQRRVDKFMEDE
jgi:hypothetical protein